MNSRPLHLMSAPSCPFLLSLTYSWKTSDGGASPSECFIKVRANDLPGDAEYDNRRQPTEERTMIGVEPRSGAQRPGYLPPLSRV